MILLRIKMALRALIGAASEEALREEISMNDVMFQAVNRRLRNLETTVLYLQKQRKK